MPRKKAEEEQQPGTEVAVVDDAKAELRPTDDSGSIIQYRIGDRTVDTHVFLNCAVCTHQARAHIERNLILNNNFASIVRQYSDIDHTKPDGSIEHYNKVTVAQIKNHWDRNHVPITAKQLHDIRTERYGNQDYETDLIRPILHDLSISDMTRLRVQERMVNGELEPTIKEGLLAEKITNDYKLSRQSFDQVDRTWIYQRSFKIYFDAARAIMTVEQWGLFEARLMNDPLLKQLVEQLNSTDKPEEKSA